MDLIETLKSHGFEDEMTGGGCVCLALYNESGSYVWITDDDGSGMPDEDGWMICAYPADFDGDYEEGLLHNDSGKGGPECVLSALSAILATYQHDQGLPRACAMETLMGADLTDAQRKWLSNFCDDWDVAQAAADAEAPCPINRRPKSTCPDGCTHGAAA